MNGRNLKGIHILTSLLVGYPSNAVNNGSNYHNEDLNLQEYSSLGSLGDHYS